MPTMPGVGKIGGRTEIGSHIYILKANLHPRCRSSLPAAVVNSVIMLSGISGTSTVWNWARYCPESFNLDMSGEDTWYCESVSSDTLSQQCTQGLGRRTALVGRS